MLAVRSTLNLVRGPNAGSILHRYRPLQLNSHQGCPIVSPSPFELCRKSEPGPPQGESKAVVMDTTT